MYLFSYLVSIIDSSYEQFYSKFPLPLPAIDLVTTWLLNADITNKLDEWETNEVISMARQTMFGGSLLPQHGASSGRV
jgi:hypothetical protein